MFLMPMSAVGFGAHYGVTGYEPAGALMFDGSTDLLQRKLSSASNQTTWTIDLIFKYTGLGVTHRLFEAYSGASDFMWANIGSGGELAFAQYSASGYDFQYVTNQKFRDPGAWYNLCVAVDTTQGSASNRVHIYLNGTEITAFSTESNPSSSFSTDWNAAVNTALFSRTTDIADADRNEFSGFVAQIIHVDGQQLTPSSFGELSDNGIWVPIDPSNLTFGTNGFWLNFADGNNIGNDAANSTTTAATVTGASGIWSGDTGSFTFSGDDLQVAAGDKGIYTTDAYLGNVVVTGVWHGDFSEGGIAFAKYSANLAANFSSGATFGIHTGQRLATVLNQSIYSVKLHFHDFENALENRMTNVSPEATSATDPSGENFEWRRSAAGVVTFKLGSTTIFTGNDGYTGPVHVLFGNHGTYTSPIDIDDLSIAHEGVVGNQFIPTSMGANNIIAGGPANSTTKEMTIYASLDPLRTKSDMTLSNNNLNVTKSASDRSNSFSNVRVSSGRWYWEVRVTNISTSVEQFGLGVGDPSVALDWNAGSAANAWLCFQKGTKITATDSSSSAFSGHDVWAEGMVLQFDMDLDAGTLKVAQNGGTYYTIDNDLDDYSNLSPMVNQYATRTAAFRFAENSWSYSSPGGSALTTTITGVGNYATWNPLSDDGTGVALSNGNLNANRTGDNGTIQATLALPETGKWAWQSTIDEQDVAYHGIMGYDQLGTVFGGSTAGNAGYVACMIYHSSQGSELNKETTQISTGLTSFVAGDIIEILVDVDSATMDVKRNGSSHGSQITGIAIQKPWIPFIGSGQQMDYGATDFGQNGYTPSNSTYKTLHTGNFPEPAVPNYEDEYFIKTGISHTNGSTTAVTLPKTVSGGAMVRIKRTDSTSDWYVVDTVRGVNKYILWNEQDAEDTSTWSDQNLTSTTLTLPSALASGTYLIECFYVGSYFQIKAFTGNASATAISFDSALSGEFGAAFVKNRTDSGSPGASFFQHKSLGGTKYLHPYSTDDVQTNIVGWNNTAATTTQITVGTHNGVNGASDAMIVYAWANSGPYAFGEVTSGNTSGDDFMVHVGGFPQTKFVKKHNAVEGWYFSAFAIDGYNPTKYMNLESTIAAAPDVAYDHLAIGFKSRDTTTSTRGSTHELVWGAFGITPFASNNRAR